MVGKDKMNLNQRKITIDHAVEETLNDLIRLKTIIVEEPKMGKSVDAQNSDGLTRLMIASISGNLPAVKRMVKKNAKLDLVNRDGNSAIMLAAWNGHYDISRFLERAGANVNILNRKGQDITTLILESLFEMDGIVSKSGKLKRLSPADAQNAGHISKKTARQTVVEEIERSVQKDMIVIQNPPHC